MDLSGVIFVVLALAWAGYLIPRALRHHEEIAASRPVDSFSDTMRVLERTPATMKALLTPPAVATAKKPKRAKAPAPVAAPVAAARPTSRTAAKAAARRRRRVLSGLLLLTVVTAGVAGAGYLPWLSVTVPGLLVLGWLVLCRLMVRRSRPAVARSTVADHDETTRTVAAEPLVAAPAAAPRVAEAEVDLDDDGSLWDPLPLTLPTYVTKPAARRTVRTIDLTRTDVTSSGHKAEDSVLARAAEAEAKTAQAAEEPQQRKAAGA